MDDYRIERIDPISTGPYSADTGRKEMRELKNVSKMLLESNEKISQRLESVIAIWMDFIKTLKEMDMGEGGEGVKSLVEQNKKLMDQNQKILEYMEYLEDKIERMGRSSSRSPSSYRLAPRKYPKIKIVK